PGAENVHRAPENFTLGEAIHTTSFWLLAASWGIVMFSMAMMITHTVAYLLDMGIEIGVAATIFSLLPGMSIVGKLGAGFLGLRINTRLLALGAVALMAIAMAILVFTKYLPLIVAGAVLLGLGFGAALTSFLDCFPSFFGPKNNAKVIGTSLPITMLLGGIGAPFAGFFFDFSGSYMIPFSTVIVLLVVALVCLLTARRPSLPSTRAYSEA
ncbi:MAG: MFS transporter, partial [Pseudomonadales bacterium]